MNSRLSRDLTITTLCLCFFISGCFGGKTAPLRSERLQKAEAALSKGTRAEQKGNYSESTAYFSEALSESTLIEDFTIRVTSLINLSRLHRTQQDLVRAERYLDQAFELKSESKSLLAEIYFEKSLLELAKGHPVSALSWAEQSVAAETGNQRGSRLNLAARINLALGNPSAAQTGALQALHENRSVGQLEEEANSLRVLGIVERSAARYTEGESFFKTALALDKQIGKSGKIAVDLEELGATSLSANNLRQAAGYLERAREIHIASGRKSAALKNLETLANIYDRVGDPTGAEKTRASARELSAVSDSTLGPKNHPIQ